MNKDRIWTLMSRKLAGEATEAELTELNELIVIHPDIDIPVQVLNEYWRLDAEKEEEFLEATFHLHTQRLKEKGFDFEKDKSETGSLNIIAPVNSKRKVFFTGSLIALVLIVLFFSIYHNDAGIKTEKKIVQSEVSTKNGSRTKIQLPDGSSVWLNSGSKITYHNENFGAALREVSLTGEAYFDVVKDHSKPFIIHTAKMDIKVLGTAFNVKCYPGEKSSETSLIRGSIEVTLKNRPEKIMMKPNEKLVLNDDELKPARFNFLSKKIPLVKQHPIIELGHLTIFPKDSSVVETAWVENRLVFSSESFENIAIQMERWYGVKITIANEKIKKQLFTGIFERESVYQALNALQLTTAFTYKTDFDKIIISK